MTQSYERIPTDLKELRQWVLWKYETTDTGKPTKIPYIAKLGDLTKASTSDSETWRTFEDAVSLYQRVGCDGIGFVCSKGDPYIGIDLDSCIDENGSIENWALDIINRFQSYAEKSPSGHGIHIINKGKLSGTGARGELPGYPGARVEIYDQHYFTMTGDIIEGYDTIQERQQDIDWLYNLLKPSKPEPSPKPETTYPKHNMTNDQILDVIQKSKQADKFNLLWSGSHEGYESPSEADLALCAILAFYTQDEKQIVSILQDCKGVWDDKWEREDYQTRTIGKALEGLTDIYKPKRKKEPSIIESGQTFPTTSNPLFNAYIDILEKCNESPKSYNFFCLASVIGLAISRGAYFKADFNLYPNLYILLVGPSGFGRKTTAQRYIYDLTGKALPTKQILASIDTWEGLLQAMSAKDNSLESQPEMIKIDYNNTIAVLSEFKGFLKKARNQAIEHLIPNLCNAYDCDDSLETNTRINPIKVKNPFLSIVAGIQPSILTDTFQAGDLHGGFASRFMYVWDKPVNIIPLPCYPDDINSTKWNSIISQIQKIYKHFNGKSIPYNLESRELWDDIYSDIITRARAIKNDLLLDVINRVQNHVAKLALIFACSEVGNDDFRYVITDKHIEDAYRIVNWLWTNTENLFKEFGQDESLILEHRIIEILGNNKGEINKRDLHLKLSGRVKAYMLSNSLESLESMDRIKIDGSKITLCV